MVSIITCTIRDSLINEVFNNYKRQLCDEKELIIILNNDLMDLYKWEYTANQYQNVRVVKMPEEASLGECLNYGIEISKQPYIAKFDDDDYYSPYYLQEAMDAFQKNEASIIGKTSVFMYFKKLNLLTVYMPGKENKYTYTESRLNSKLVMGGTLVFKKEVYQKVKFPKKNVGEDSDFILGCIEGGLKTYATSKYNYVTIRHSSEQIHTWQVKNQKLLRFCTGEIETCDYIPYVLKPVKSIGN